jgi:hypothetical protein
MVKNTKLIILKIRLKAGELLAFRKDKKLGSLPVIFE